MGEIIEICDIIEGGLQRLCRRERETVEGGDCEDVRGEIANRESCICRRHIGLCAGLQLVTTDWLRYW